MLLAEECLLREQIVKEALSWIGTNYHDRAGIKGVGVDCAYLPLRIYQAVGLIPEEYQTPHYHPQQWLKKDIEDTAFMDELLKFAKEITESEIKSGDLVIYKMVNSWTHGAIVIVWPTYLLHPIAGRGVMGSRDDEGFLRRRERKFFSFLR